VLPQLKLLHPTKIKWCFRNTKLQVRQVREIYVLKMSNDLILWAFWVRDMLYFVFKAE